MAPQYVLLFGRGEWRQTCRGVLAETDSEDRAHGMPRVVRGAVHLQRKSWTDQRVFVNSFEYDIKSVHVWS